MASDFEHVLGLVRQLRDDREWAQFHNPKDLALSIAIESGELLETFQWSGADLECMNQRAESTAELADVLIYCLYMADALAVDPLAIIEDKLKADAGKYPVERFRGVAGRHVDR